jgi:hypothetical protein
MSRKVSLLACAGLLVHSYCYAGTGFNTDNLVVDIVDVEVFVSKAAHDVVVAEKTTFDMDDQETKNLATWAAQATDGMHVVYQYVVNLVGMAEAHAHAPGNQIDPIAANIGHVTEVVAEALLEEAFPLPLAEIIADKIGDTAVDLADYLVDQMKTSEDSNSKHLASAHNYSVHVVDGKMQISLPCIIKNSDLASWSVTEIVSEEREYIQIQVCLLVTKDVSLQIAYNFLKPEGLRLDYGNAVFVHDVTGYVTVAFDIARGVKGSPDSEVTPAFCVLSILQKSINS